MFDDFEDEDGAEKFYLSFTAKYGSTHVNITRNFKAEDLTTVLNEVVQFLQSAGYTYVEQIEAHGAHGISHSSDL